MQLKQTSNQEEPFPFYFHQSTSLWEFSIPTQSSQVPPLHLTPNQDLLQIAAVQSHTDAQCVCVYTHICHPFSSPLFSWRLVPDVNEPQSAVIIRLIHLR